jgi:2-polyprenyl-6-methoxyphenol hydroxylase-like FAD-dependent oxidoreductase
MASIERALIVGAGLGGLAVALRLRALGIAVEIVERRPAAEAHGAGILLTGNALRMLEELGVADAVLARGLRVVVVRFTDDQGGELFRVDCMRAGWPAFVSIRRDALQQQLLAVLAPLAPRWGTTVAALQEGASDVEVSFSDGGRGRYGLVVAADGVHSQLRTELFAAEPVQPIAGFFGWRFVAPLPPGLSHPQYMLGNGRTLLLHPLPGGEVYCGAGPIGGPAPGGGSELEQLRSAFQGFGGPAAQVLQALDGEAVLIPTSYFHVEQRPWRKGRCVLIGDAAHACAPTLAQGGAMAFEDAVVLGEALRDTGELGAALDAFERRRAPRVGQVQAASLARMAVNRPSDARGVAVRNGLLRTIGAEQLLGAWSPLMERSP